MNDAGFQKCEPIDFTGFEPPASADRRDASVVISQWLNVCQYLLPHGFSFALAA